MTEPATTTGEVIEGQPAALMFLVAGRQFAVDLNRVQHILEYQAPTRTPLSDGGFSAAIRRPATSVILSNVTSAPALMGLGEVGRDDGCIPHWLPRVHRPRV